jgi:hypothetical protein
MPRKLVETITDLLGRVPLSAHQLLFRLAIASVFLPAGLLKLASWESTIALFQDEYKVPMLPPVIAAMLATTVELGCSSLLIAGARHPTGHAPPARADCDHPAFRLPTSVARTPGLGLRLTLPADTRCRSDFGGPPARPLAQAPILLRLSKLISTAEANLFDTGPL